MENVLLPIMYEAPADKSVKKIVVTKDCVEKSESPLVERANGEKKLKRPDGLPKTDVS